MCKSEQGWVLQEHFDCLSYEGFTVETYTLHAAEPTHILNEGDVLDLGNRAFEVLHLPGHSPGCIALYDPRSKDLFSGDIIYDGVLLDELHCSHIPTYIATYERLQRLSVDTIYPGHYSTFGKQRYHEIVRRVSGVPTPARMPVRGEAVSSQSPGISSLNLYNSANGFY